MRKYSADLGLKLLLRPVGMLAAQESRLVPSYRPIKPMGGLPSLRRGHATENRHLFRTGLLVCQHKKRMRWNSSLIKPAIDPNAPEKDARNSITIAICDGFGSKKLCSI
jgi:hypothetical protein